MSWISTIADGDDGVVQSLSASLSDDTISVASEPVILGFNSDGDWVSINGLSEEALVGGNLSQTNNLDKWASNVWRTSACISIPTIVWILFHLGNTLLPGTEPSKCWIHETTSATIAARGVGTWDDTVDSLLLRHVSEWSTLDGVVTLHDTNGTKSPA